MTTTTISVRSERVFNGRGTLRPFSTKYYFANPNFDPEAPRLLDQAFNPAAVREFGGCSRDAAVAIIRRVYAGQGTITVAWDDRAPQAVRTQAVK